MSQLRRRLTPLQAVCLNMSMMVGIGPFITIPLMIAAVKGPQGTLGWVMGLAVAACDGLVWSELAAAFPGSGGTYHFFDAIYGESRVGRALKFLFVWQFLVSGPLEMASGMLGFAAYAGWVWPSLDAAAWSLPVGGGLTWTVTRGQLVGAATMAGLVRLAYRRIEAAGRLMVVLWLGMLATVAWTIAAAWAHFDPARAFDLPPDAWRLDATSFVGYGQVLGYAMYAVLRLLPGLLPRRRGRVAGPDHPPVDPDRHGGRGGDLPRDEPRASSAAMPWRARRCGSGHIASDLMERLYNPRAAALLSLMVMWTAVAACFAALLGYSRIPYAAARSGHFFRALASTHPTGDFPHRSLLVLGAVSVFACLLDLQTVIEALLTTRILVQFVAQIATVVYLRTRPDLVARMPFRMPLFPLPALIALVGWSWIFRHDLPDDLVPRPRHARRRRRGVRRVGPRSRQAEALADELS